MPRTAAVTGTTSGLGRDIALGLAARNYQVFGTARRPEQIEEMKQTNGDAINLTICDVTNGAAVEAWAHEVSVQTGGGLDVLVNNAGTLTPGPLEVVPIEAIRVEFEVNVFGSLRVINSFLPLLRKNRGRIVHISTWTASLPLPFNGPSGASKAAMEAFASVYRAELRPFGVDVVVAAPGSMLTGGPAKSAGAIRRMAESMTDAQRALYGKAFDTFETVFNRGQSNGMSSADAAAQVIEIAEQNPAPILAPVGKEAQEILQFVREKSYAEQDSFRLRLMGLEDLGQEESNPSLGRNPSG